MAFLRQMQKKTAVGFPHAELWVRLLPLSREAMCKTFPLGDGFVRDRRKRLESKKSKCIAVVKTAGQAGQWRG